MHSSIATVHGDETFLRRDIHLILLVERSWIPDDVGNGDGA